MSSSCPICGSALPPDAPKGICPRCLLGAGLTPLPDEPERGSPEPQHAVSSDPVGDLQDPSLSQAAAGGDTRAPGNRHFGDYELLSEIAQGGMGIVYRARQLSLNRIVAIKMLLYGRFTNPRLVERFRAEARAAAALRHPHIVAIHEVGEHDGQPYFSMDYVSGKNLADLVRDQPLPARRAAAYLKTIAQAVHYAHQNNILHRDLKPSNILIDQEDQPRVTDFGLAKRVESLSELRVESGDVARGGNSQLSTQDPLNPLTVTGQMLGSPSYMPPEQVEGTRHPPSPASDVYSLGAILYHLLTGRPPFLAESLQGTLLQVTQNDPPSLRLLQPSVPRDLETICLKCLEKEPRRRYPTAEDLANELDSFLRGEPIQARAISAGERLWRWCRRKPALAASLFLIFILLLILIIGSPLAAYRINRERQRAEEHATRETAQRQRAEEAVTLLELQRAEDLLEKDEITMGVAWLARIVRQQPANRIGAQRLLSALTQRNFALPVGARLQHSGRVFHAEFSPDGRRVVTASADFTARVWDAQTGEPLTSPMLHQGAVRTAHFSPDGGRLLTFTDQFRAHLWELATGRALGQPMAHARKIRSAQFSSDGQRVLTASDDGTARVWDARTGEPLLEPLTHQGPVISARFSPDDRQIVTASEDKTAQVWDALTGWPAAKPFRHRSGVDGAEFSPDGKWVVTVSKDLLTCVWDVASGEPFAKPLVHPTPVLAARFSPDGERIVTWPYNGEARVWRSRDWAPLGRPMQHRGPVECIEFGPEAQRLLTGSSDSTARLWDAENGEALSAPMQHDGMVRSARLSPDGMFAVTASVDKTARIWDVRLGGVRSEPMRHAGPVLAAEFSPDGEWVLTGSMDRTARIWNSHTSQPRELVLQHAAWVLAVTFTQDGRRIATGARDGTARIWDAVTSQPLTGPLRHGDTVDRVQFSPDGQTLATASWQNTAVRLWNARTGEPQGEPIHHRENVHVLSFSPDGRWLLSDDFQSNLGQIRDVESHRLLIELRGHEGYLHYGEFSPDGQRVLTASEDGTARIWDAHTGRPLTGPLRHKGQVVRARFSPDGRRVLTASHEGSARVWDVPPTVAAGILPAVEPGVPPGGTNVRTSRALAIASASPDGKMPPSKTGETPAATALFLADLADAVLGKRVNAQGALESVSSTRLDELHQRIGALPRDADFTRWLEWLFADRSTRTISPYSPIAMADYVWSRAKETNETSWREALTLCPNQGYAFARLARHQLQQSKSPASSEAALADWNSRRAVSLASWDWWSWQQRVDVLEYTGAWTNLLTEAALEIQIHPTNHHAWEGKARAFAALRQDEIAVDAFTRALKLGDEQQRFDSDPYMRHRLLLGRSDALRHLGRMAEAAADIAAVLGLAARDPQAGPHLIDLGLFYNGGGTEGLPGAIQRLAGTDFDFRGWIHLDARRVWPQVTYLPERVNGIPIDRPCRRLHFLQTASFATHIATNASGLAEEHLKVPFGIAVGHYVIHSTDGQEVDVPILHGRDVRDYFHNEAHTPDDPALVVAWTVATAGSRRHQSITRLYKQTWVNPRPDVPIRSFDFVHAGTHAVPILVALTAE